MSLNDLSTSETVQTPVGFEPVALGNTKYSQILSVQELATLNQRSNYQGFLQLAFHLSIMGASGYLWATQFDRWFVALPALVVYGFTLASMFATMHESVHRTAFASNRTNEIVAWLAGLLSFYNSTFYRRYHKWHHRYTQLPDKDPELSDRKPSNLWEYFLEISGYLWWQGKLRGYLRMALGRLDDCPFIPQTAQSEVIRSVRLQLGAYAAAIALSVAVGQPWFFLGWLLPLAVGQPILRLILLAEHTGCTQDDNPLTNTRTTLTIAPIRWLMWNMPYHAEHHLYPSIPFHALPAAHEKLCDRFTHVEQGYLKVNRNLIATFEQ